MVRGLGSFSRRSERPSGGTRHRTGRFRASQSQAESRLSLDAFPDRKYDGVIAEISPEANRQKATVQMKVQILNPDEYLRPEMNSTVKFLANEEKKEVGSGTHRRR